MDSGLAWVKLNVLANGLELDPSIAERCSDGGIAIRRNVYNTPLWSSQRGETPQEVYLGDLVLAVNSYGASEWTLRHDAERDAPILEHRPSKAIWFARYIDDLPSLADDDVAARANLYGGAALAFFSPRSCYFFADGTACRFCSLDGTRREVRDYQDYLSADDVATAVQAVLADEATRIEQVMIVGGNMRDLDRGFKHHMSLARAAADVISSASLGEVISVHVATMPPRDLALIELASEIDNLHVMFNLEVWDPERFEEICPGKHRDYGREGILSALMILRDAVGAYKAHSLLIAGLEKPRSSLEGARALAEAGISPILNVYHSDRHSSIGLGSRPSFALLSEVALGLQQLYEAYPILPYWRRCGRNAIDREAQTALFSEPVPPVLQGASA